MRVLRRLCLIVCLAAALGCSAAKPPAVSPPLDLSAQLAAAEALLNAGCYDCLREALQSYQQLRTISAAAPASVDRATAGEFRSAALLAARERELGMIDAGHLQTARTLRESWSCGGASLPCQTLDQILDVIQVLPTGSAGRVSRPPANDAQISDAQRFNRGREEWGTLLRDAAGQDVLAAYVWLSFVCTGGGNIPRQEAVAATGTLRDLPLLQYTQVSCYSPRADNLQAILTGDPRFLEVTYLLGLANISGLKLDEADVELSRAYAWHPAWPTVTLALGNVAMTAEDFERALTYYDKSLELDPRAMDGLIGKIQALTYLGRYEDAIAATDQLLAARWNPGTALYWRAFNELQLRRLDTAWYDVEDSAKLLFNAAVPKLAGLIAYRRQQLDVARAQFDESRTRDASDCETGFYLGQVLAEQKTWTRTADVFIETAKCLDGGVNALNLDIARIRASDARPERKARAIERRDQQIASLRRMHATSTFNTAVAYYNLSRGAEARPFAELVANDEQFGERARDLLSLLK